MIMLHGTAQMLALLLETEGWRCVNANHLAEYAASYPGIGICFSCLHRPQHAGNSAAAPFTEHDKKEQREGQPWVLPAHLKASRSCTAWQLLHSAQLPCCCHTGAG